MPTPIRLRATVLEVVGHGPDVRSFILGPERILPRFKPGQFLHLALDAYSPSGHWPDSRVFSIASPPSERSRLRITVSRKGRFTTRLFDELGRGSEVWVKLPYGSFCPTAQAGSALVLLAGGTGVTPFVSFIDWVASTPPPSPEATVHVHYAARHADLLIYREQLEARCAASPWLQLTCYAENGDEGLGRGLVSGRIDIKDVWAKLEEPGTTRFYLSGPRPMIDCLRADLVTLGATPSQVFTDEWET